MNTRSGSLPKHQYVFVDTAFTHMEPVGLAPAVWFGLCSIPGRAWGLHIMLECGAVYRNLPPHAISFTETLYSPWGVTDAQLWDCYGDDWAAVEYKFLRGLTCKTLAGDTGTYIFTAVPMNDGFSEAPDQAKEFMFIELDNGRLTILPTNKVLFTDRSFTTDDPPPKLKLLTQYWSCEE